MIYKTWVAIRFLAKKPSLRWSACGAVGRAVYGHVIGNFLGWVVYHIFLPMVLRCARFVLRSAPIDLMIRDFLSIAARNNDPS